VFDGKMKILLAPDKFKGSLGATEVAECIRRGFQRGGIVADYRILPIADGGEGTAEAMRAALDGTWIDASAHDALGREITARYAWANGVAIIEMSSASGMWRIDPCERDPLHASTFGTGELIADAARRGARQIFVGLGGSATNDAGAGMAAALGYRFLTSDGDPLEPVPANLLALLSVRAPENLTLPPVIALCDVRNPLLGERGATRVFGPQKGATPAMVHVIEQALEHLADIVAQDLECDHRNVPGAGAAGGLGFGLVTFCGASIRRGFETVAELIHLEQAIAESDLVVTGEGRIDAQTLEGKGPDGVARFARKHGKPVIALAGGVTPEGAALFDIARAIAPEGMPIEEAITRAVELVESAAAAVAAEVKELVRAT
jgi:glycerate kinase